MTSVVKPSKQKPSYNAISVVLVQQIHFSLVLVPIVHYSFSSGTPVLP